MDINKKYCCCYVSYELLRASLSLFLCSRLTLINSSLFAPRITHNIFLFISVFYTPASPRFPLCFRRLKNVLKDDVCDDEKKREIKSKQI